MDVFVLIPGPELQDASRTCGQRLEGKTPARVPGNPCLFKHEWKQEEHERFAQSILDHSASLRGRTSTVGSILSEYTAEAGIRVEKSFMPLLLLLESGIQWIMPGQLAVIVALKLSTNNYTAKAIIHRHGEMETVEVEVGSVLILYGDHVGWELQEGSVSFLHIPVHVYRI